MSLTHLECSRCGRSLDAGQRQQLCECGGPLLARYDLSAAARDMRPGHLALREPTLWRYREVLPAASDSARVSLGEGFTPLLPVPRLANSLGLPGLLVKDESLNPTGSFKARGLAVAVTMARSLGAQVLCAPSAGNAGGALAAYAARAGLEAHVFVPRDTPRACVAEARACGARVHMVNGLIDEAGRECAEAAAAAGWYECATLKEPYRIEGKKTMGYELAEQLEWRLPDAIVYPTGGGTGLIGMWKAFEELETLGFVGPQRPRLYCVQADGCAPIVKAFSEGRDTAEPWPDARTLAFGLRVPRALGDFLILRALRASHGSAVAVSDAELLDGVREASRLEGIFVAPEGGACVAALRRLKASGHVAEGERVVLFNTGTGLKYVDALPAPLDGSPDA